MAFSSRDGLNFLTAEGLDHHGLQDIAIFVVVAKSALGSSTPTVHLEVYRDCHRVEITSLDLTDLLIMFPVSVDDHMGRSLPARPVSKSKAAIASYTPGV